MNSIRYAVVAGLVLWAIGTALLVLLGRHLFGPDNRVPAAVWGGAIVVLTFLAVYRFSHRILRRAGEASMAEGALIGVFMCTPALLLDGALYAVNQGRYPGLDIAASGAVSATLMLTYAAALVASVTSAR